MKKIYFTGFLFLFIFSAFSQTTNQPIEINKGFWGTTFTQNGQTLKMKQLLAITERNNAAFVEMKKARTNNTVGTIIGSIGGFLVGYTLGYSISGKPVNWTVAGVGAGLIGVSVPFSIGATKRAKKGVEIYNAGLN